MKIAGINTNFIKNHRISVCKGLMCISLTLPLKTFAQNMENNNDTFDKTEQAITPQGVDYMPNVLFPSPQICVAGDSVNASIVVDVSKNTLYTYDINGYPLKAYLIASGKTSSPTKKGIKKVIATEKYPYKSAPTSSKRHNKPWIYGSRVIVLANIDIETGKVTNIDGQFIHGNNDVSSLGKYASMGCIRMDNDAIKEVSVRAINGNYVLVK